MAFFKLRKPPFEGGGLVLFLDVAGAMMAEKVLKEAGYAVRLVAPPLELRQGCDLAVGVNLVEKPGIEHLLGERGVDYVGVVPLRVAASELMAVIKVTDFGSCMMVRAGNMKLTFDKESGTIVNTSGGGCPDIPRLYTELVGRKLTEASCPRSVGFTLCALMQERALEESIALWQESI